MIHAIWQTTSIVVVLSSKESIMHREICDKALDWLVVVMIVVVTIVVPQIIDNL